MTQQPPAHDGPARNAALRSLDAGCDALRFFTRLTPPDRWSAQPPARFFDGVAAAAPLAGALIGVVTVAVAGAAMAIGLPAAAAAVFAVAAGVALSGALHQDGLADVADGFGGGATRDRKLEIMRDSRLGAYGGVALVLALAARIALVAALAAKIEVGGAAALVAAAALARPAALLPAILLEPARSDGAGHAARPGPRFVAMGCACGAALALTLCGAAAGLVATVAAGAAALAVVEISRRQIGGYTGDVCGAAAEIAEIAALAALVAALGPG
jgi:adenosylcobinamide-GDP ribazoletransferase